MKNDGSLNRIERAVREKLEFDPEPVHLMTIEEAIDYLKIACPTSRWSRRTANVFLRAKGCHIVEHWRLEKETE